ncbi:hypothetical protein [Kitasatospora sp. NPDC057223]|uniref:hypothetical protein n=1 Tax=Kitasatospora sp. NPDC057223 TaxID=3346055 RepID=UPI003639EF6A
MTDSSPRASGSAGSSRAARPGATGRTGRRARPAGPGRAAATAEAAGTAVAEDRPDDSPEEGVATDEPAAAEEAEEPEEPAVRVPRPRAGRVGAARRRRRRGPSLRGRVTAALLAGALALVLGVVAWSVPSTRKVLLESFTERPRPYAELFFTSSPSFEGATVLVPLAVTDHGEGAKGYQIKVTLESPTGAAVATTTVKLEAHFGAPVPVVAKLPATGDVAMLRVALVGHPQTLHFRFGSAQPPKP